jgi:hypothetical protein
MISPPSSFLHIHHSYNGRSRIVEIIGAYIFLKRGNSGITEYPEYVDVYT